MGSRIECKCGNVINTGSFPNKGIYHLVSEESYDEVVDPFDRMKAARLFVGGDTLTICNQCNRILLVRGVEVSFYSTETD
jgi:hypothetical protein